MTQLASLTKMPKQQMTAKDLDEFGNALGQLIEVFYPFPDCCNGMDTETSDGDARSYR